MGTCESMGTCEWALVSGQGAVDMHVALMSGKVLWTNMLHL